MFTSRGRARGPRTVRRLGWNRLQVHRLESRIAPAQLVVTSAADDGGAGTLRSILAVANTNGEADTITFASAVTSITLATGQLTISESKNLTIDGGGTVSINGTATASATNRIFNLTATGQPTIAINRLTLANGNLSTASGAGILMTNQILNLFDVTLSNNKTTVSGGAIATIGSGSKIEIANSVLMNNSAAQGGAIASAGATITLTGSTIAGNELRAVNSYSNGGALSFSNCTITINSCKLTGNANYATSTSSAWANGGCVYCVDSSLSINNTTFSGNSIHIGDLSSSAWASGGSIYCENSSVSINNTTISGNEIRFGIVTASWGMGGGIYCEGGTLSLISCSISDNVINNSNNSSLYGAGLYATESVVLISNCTIAYNVINNSVSSTSGGGIYFDSPSANPEIVSSIVANNSAKNRRDLDGYPAQLVVLGNNSLIGIVEPLRINLTGSGNQSGTTTNPLNAGIFRLSDLGGPTPTLGLHYTSPALNQGSNPQLLTTDQRGFPREVPTGMPDVGAVEGFELLPFVDSVSTISDIKSSGGTVLNLTVTYDSPFGIDTTTIDGNDIVVSGRLPMQQIALKSVTTIGNKSTALYQVIPPGGAWDSTDTGAYTISLAPNQVRDLANPSKDVAAQVFGTFSVSIAGKFVVDSLDDQVDDNYGPGQFTLREALQIANVDTISKDTITFDSITFATQKTIDLTDELFVGSPVVITGPGANRLTLSGGGKCRVLNLAGSYSTSVSGLTLANGNSAKNGGGILTNQTLTLANCTLVNNVAMSSGGAISHESSSNLTITDCTLMNNVAVVNGGAISLNYPRLTMTRTTLQGNSAANGGAVYLISSYGNSAPIIDNSTFSGNSATQFGGAICLGNSPYNWAIRNSTLTANSAGLAGGGIFRGTNTGSILLTSSIIAGNQAIIGPDLFFDNLTAVPTSNSLIGIIDSGNLSLSGSANLTGTKAAPLDAKLGPLANNGGPTLTHALLLGSPAINAGSNTNKLATDQRGTGFNRVVGGQADIGAFEVQSPPPRALSFQVNDGSPQRSLLTSFKVSFSEAVLFPNGASAAFELIRTGPGTPNGIVSINAVASGSEVTITFVNGGAIALDPGGSLPDGRYQLSIIANQVIGFGGFLDGDGNGIPGDSAFFATHRLFGDSNGDGVVSAIDYNAFRIAYASASPVFDFNKDGVVSAFDFQQFRFRYGLLI